MHTLNVQSHAHAHIDMCSHTHAHTNMHSHMHTYTHSHAQSHTHTHAQSQTYTHLQTEISNSKNLRYQCYICLLLKPVTENILQTAEKGKFSSNTNGRVYSHSSQMMRACPTGSCYHGVLNSPFISLHFRIEIKYCHCILKM